MSLPSITIATTQRRTALACIQAAMAEVGMPRPNTLEDPYDETAVQLLSLYNALGESLCLFPFFEELTTTWSITTTTADAYDLPADWGTPVSGTNWDRTGRWPLLGPRTASEWQFLKSGFGVAAPQYRFRFFGGQFNLFPAPIAGLTIVQEYISKFWVLGVGTNPAIADTGKIRVTMDSDYGILDERMMIEGLQLAFLEKKGLDSTLQNRKWETMMEAAWANSKGAPILNLAPTPSSIFLSEYNVPDTGFGV